MTQSDEFVIREEVRQAMAERGDEPRSNEIYVVTDEGHQISQTFARDGVYYAVFQDAAIRIVQYFWRHE